MTAPGLGSNSQRNPSTNSMDDQAYLREVEIKNKQLDQLIKRAENLEFLKEQKLSQYRLLYDNIVKNKQKLRSASTVQMEIDRLNYLLEMSKNSVSLITSVQLDEIIKYNNPPQRIKLTLEAVMFLLNGKKMSWDEIRSQMSRGDFISRIIKYNPRKTNRVVINALKNEYLTADWFDVEKIRSASQVVGPLAEWLLSQLNYLKSIDQIEPVKEELNQLKSERLELEQQEIELRNEIHNIETMIDIANIQKENLKEEIELLESGEEPHTNVQERISDYLQQSLAEELNENKQTLPYAHQYSQEIYMDSAREQLPTLEVERQTVQTSVQYAYSDPRTQQTISYEPKILEQETASHTNSRKKESFQLTGTNFFLHKSSSNQNLKRQSANIQTDAILQHQNALNYSNKLIQVEQSELHPISTSIKQKALQETTVQNGDDSNAPKFKKLTLNNSADGKTPGNQLFDVESNYNRQNSHENSAFYQSPSFDHNQNKSSNSHQQLNYGDFSNIKRQLSMQTKTTSGLQRDESSQSPRHYSDKNALFISFEQGGFKKGGQTNFHYEAKESKGFHSIQQNTRRPDLIAETMSETNIVNNITGEQMNNSLALTDISARMEMKQEPEGPRSKNTLTQEIGIQNSGTLPSNKNIDHGKPQSDKISFGERNMVEVEEIRTEDIPKIEILNLLDEQKTIIKQNEAHSAMNTELSDNGYRPARYNDFSVSVTSFLDRVRAEPSIYSNPQSLLQRIDDQLRRYSDKIQEEKILTTLKTIEEGAVDDAGDQNQSISDKRKSTVNGHSERDTAGFDGRGKNFTAFNQDPTNANLTQPTQRNTAISTAVHNAKIREAIKIPEPSLKSSNEKTRTTEVQKTTLIEDKKLTEYEKNNLLADQDVANSEHQLLNVRKVSETNIRPISQTMYRVDEQTQTSGLRINSAKIVPLQNPMVNKIIGSSSILTSTVLNADPNKRPKFVAIDPSQSKSYHFDAHGNPQEKKRIELEFTANITLEKPQTQNQYPSTLIQQTTLMSPRNIVKTTHSTQNFFPSSTFKMNPVNVSPSRTADVPTIKVSPPPVIVRTASPIQPRLSQRATLPQRVEVVKSVSFQGQPQNHSPINSHPTSARPSLYEPRTYINQSHLTRNMSPTLHINSQRIGHIPTSSIQQISNVNKQEMTLTQTYPQQKSINSIPQQPAQQIYVRQNSPIAMNHTYQKTSTVTQHVISHSPTRVIQSYQHTPIVHAQQVGQPKFQINSSVNLKMDSRSVSPSISRPDLRPTSIVTENPSQKTIIHRGKEFEPVRIENDQRIFRLGEDIRK